MAESRSAKNKRRFSLSSTSAGETRSVGEGVARELAQSEHIGEGDLQSIRMDRIRPSELNPRKLPVDATWIQELADRARREAGKGPGEPADDEVLEQLDSAIAAQSDVRVRTSLESLMLLARSIHNDRLISPVTVRFVEGRGYELIAGERRYLAHLLLGRKNIRALLRRVDTGNPADALKSEITSLMENIAREDLSIAEQINAIDRIVQAKQKMEPDWILNGVNLMRLLHLPRRTAYRYVEALTAPSEVRARIDDGTLDSFRSIEEANREHQTAEKAGATGIESQKTSGGVAKKTVQRVSIRLDEGDLRNLQELAVRALGNDEVARLGVDNVDWSDAKAAREAVSRLLDAVRSEGE
ncbi:ParB domain protein nuclease (plasmid) [Thioalkalivibrio sp. K90mix]|uniref:ParB/RepB/Spo0J family partition protein n=1 Tax=Thioalkalivibrio sp. (strain K90mix) TaxID=396595 RepID=UPI000195A68A|nr:ParB N-terminal domain-containing protein [Thioalkalivibrio sp. K90mix]ADC73260.1 ParB domain protein nuclease [Thioalkalivibrio sp. K90mix]